MTVLAARDDVVHARGAWQPEPPTAPRFPGATLVLDAAGQITGRWLGAAAPAIGASTDLLEALDIDGNSPDAMVIQLMLASAIGAPVDAWAMFSGDAPALLYQRDGRAMAVSWDAVVANDLGMIDGVAVFATATAAPTTEPDDPAETNRLCVDALALLDDCDACLRHLAHDPRARASVHRLYRAMHTIKGSMRGPRLHAIRDLAHQAETAIESLREFDEAPADVAAELDSMIQQLRAAVTAARPRDEIDDAMTELLRECRPALVDLQLSTVRLTSGDRGAAVVASRAIDRIRAASDRAGMAALRAQCTAASHAVEALAHGAIDPAVVDEISMLDRQLELYAAVYREAAALDAGSALLTAISAQLAGLGDAGRGELTALIAGASLPSLAEALAASDPLAARCAGALLDDAPAMFQPSQPRDDTTLRFERAQRDLFGALDELAERVPAAELAALRAVVDRLSHVPLAPLVRRLTHLTRTLAAELDKRCEAKVELGELVVLPATSRVVGEILLHALRNALDHGIELAADRVAAGKPAVGAIEIAAYPFGDRLIVTVRDDGRGVDLDRVRQRAVERGLVAAPDAAGAAPAQLLDLLFHPGFSTATAVSMVSGRGIGMDVIRSLAEEHRGSVAIVSVPGRGTELTIELPLAGTPAP